MKTAIQELIEWVNEVRNSPFALVSPENELKLLDQFKNKIKSFLEAEKQQIIDAYESGKTDWGGELYKSSDNYYNQTFKP